MSTEICLSFFGKQEEFAGIVARLESLRARNLAFEPREAERQVEGLFESLLAQEFYG